MARHSSRADPTLFALEEQLAVTDAITITGSREFLTFAPDELFSSVLGAFVGYKRMWLLGGAIGVDQLATEWLLSKKEQVIAVVPFTVREQPKVVHGTLTKVGQCIDLQLRKSKKAYIDRNEFMVNRSSTVIAFWNGEKGGTWSTIQFALRQRKQVHVYPI
jgi:uncharacterized phage-like protein YoqJ